MKQDVQLSTAGGYKGSQDWWPTAIYGTLTSITHGLHNFRYTHQPLMKSTAEVKGKGPLCLIKQHAIKDMWGTKETHTGCITLSKQALVDIE